MSDSLYANVTTSFIGIAYLSMTISGGVSAPWDALFNVIGGSAILVALLVCVFYISMAQEASRSS